MFIAMNRFRVAKGSEAAFEHVWLSRDSHLDKVPGFVEFHLLKGPEAEDHTLYRPTRCGRTAPRSKPGPNPKRSAPRIIALGRTSPSISGTLQEADHLLDSALAQWLRRFKGRIARWIMHRLVGRITFGGSDWIVERLLWTSRGRGHGHLSSPRICAADAHVAAAGAETGRFSRTDPLGQVIKFTAAYLWRRRLYSSRPSPLCFASPVAFCASPFSS